MTSRLTSDYSCRHDMAMPSVTVMVVNARGVRPSALTPRFNHLGLALAKYCMGASFQVVTTPTRADDLLLRPFPGRDNMIDCARCRADRTWRLGILALSSFHGLVSSLFWRLGNGKSPGLAMPSMLYRANALLGLAVRVRTFSPCTSRKNGGSCCRRPAQTAFQQVEADFRPPAVRRAQKLPALVDRPAARVAPATG